LRNSRVFTPTVLSHGHYDHFPPGALRRRGTITYAVNGRQYAAVMTGDAQSGTAGLLDVVKNFKPVRGHNAIYVFALPEIR
jgi:hypothetical protein